MNLEDLLQQEYQGETLIQSALVSVCPNVFVSRETDSTVSPRIELKIVMGEVQQNQKLQINTLPGWIFSSWEASLQTTVITNRTTEATSNAHRILLGQVRAVLQEFSLRAFQNAQPTPGLPVFITQIRDTGSDDSVQDTDDLDVTKLTHKFVLSINPNQLPTNL